jgi:hypothetical protein
VTVIVEWRLVNDAIHLFVPAYRTQRGHR